MGRYRRKVTETEAVQWTGNNHADVKQFMGHSPVITTAPGDTEGVFSVQMRTTHGETAYARPGDWILPEARPGRFYPVAADVFDATYEPA